MATPRILLLAGEPSGDQHGAHLASALKRRVPGVRLAGLGGPRMAAEGVELWEGLDRLAVMGFAEVVRHLGFFRALEKRVMAEIEADCDLVIPIDYPGFNLRVTRKAHDRGVPVLYYIAPQVWAWKAKRSRLLAESTQGVAAILPFEPAFLEPYGARVRFVGHPLLEEPVVDEGREVFCGAHGLDAERPILALFPGSRAQEVRRHLDVFVEAAERVRRTKPELQVVVARGPGIEAELGGTDVVDAVVEGSRALLRHARAAIVKSGTTTLEAAIEGTPFVTIYKTSALTYAMARRLVSLEHIALANLVAGERVVPELLQDQATPETIAAAVRPLLENNPVRDEMVGKLAGVRSRLGDGHASEAVAAWAAEILES